MNTSTDTKILSLQDLDKECNPASITRIDSSNAFCIYSIQARILFEINPKQNNLCKIIDDIRNDKDGGANENDFFCRNYLRHQTTIININEVTQLF